jgi:hypothetical protein
MTRPSSQAPIPEKVCRTHLDRLAIVYIRQSTLQQVERHHESTRLQYGLVDRALGASGQVWFGDGGTSQTSRIKR